MRSEEVVESRGSGGPSWNREYREAGVRSSCTKGRPAYFGKGQGGRYRRTPWRKPPEWAGRIDHWRIYEIEREYRRISGDWRLFTSYSRPREIGGFEDRLGAIQHVPRAMTTAKCSSKFRSWWRWDSRGIVSPAR
jgi:hypothetical protein